MKKIYEVASQMYEIDFSGALDGHKREVEKFSNKDDLASFSLKYAIEHKLPLSDVDDAGEFMINTDHNEDSFLFCSFRDGLSEETLFTIATVILDSFKIKLYKLFDGYKTRILNIAELAHSVKDNDQYLYQCGYSSNDVSYMELQIDGNLVANYGSCVRGEQQVYCCKDVEDNLVPLGEGESEAIHKNPNLWLEAAMLQKQTGKEYLHYGLNCWLESFYHVHGYSEAVKDSDILTSNAEAVHGQIAEGIDIEKDVADEIIKIISSSKKDKSCHAA